EPATARGRRIAGINAMIRSWQVRCWLAAVFAVGQFAVFQLIAETATKVRAPQKLFSTTTNLLLPPIPHSKSPVDFFRELLALTPAERGNYLTNRPPEVRGRILAKVREYEALDPNERELRLRATELRWYLLPLMRAPLAERDEELAQVPEDLRSLAQARLAQWDLLPPAVQQELLAEDSTLHYFAQVD